MTNDDERDYAEEAHNREAYRAEQEAEADYFDSLVQDEEEHFYQLMALDIRAYFSGH